MATPPQCGDRTAKPRSSGRWIRPPRKPCSIQGWSADKAMMARLRTVPLLSALRRAVGTLRATLSAIWERWQAHERNEARGLALMSARSEEHTSELQSRQYLVCRLLLEK